MKCPNLHDQPMYLYNPMLVNRPQKNEPRLKALILSGPRLPDNVLMSPRTAAKGHEKQEDALYRRICREISACLNADMVAVAVHIHGCTRMSCMRMACPDNSQHLCRMDALGRSGKTPEHWILSYACFPLCKPQHHSAALHRVVDHQNDWLLCRADA